jgi:protein-S-isoprenylcysteine O-methyltransferase Ste14
MMTELARELGRKDFWWAALSSLFAVIALDQLLAMKGWQLAPRSGAMVAAALHLQSACLFLVRDRARYSLRSPVTLTVAVAGVSYVFLYEAAPASELSAALGGVLTAVGGLLAFLGAARLSRSYGVLPALRTLETRGIYGRVRHPIYAGYLVLDLGIVVWSPSAWNGTVCALGLALTFCRIRYEERVLSLDEQYPRYRAAVRYRLVPGLF